MKTNMEEKSDNSKNTFISLENQLIRSALHTHTQLSHQSDKINDLEAFIQSVANILYEKGILSAETLQSHFQHYKEKAMDENDVLTAGVQLRVDSEERFQKADINCSERIHICKGVCCSLRFPLSKNEVESGHVKWDLGNPYFILQSQGCCTHQNHENGGCTVYENRPSICSWYTCKEDTRIWKDFDKI